MAQMSLEEQVQKLLGVLKSRAPGRDHTFPGITKWILDLPPALRTKELLEAYKNTFQLTEREMKPLIPDGPELEDFDILVPNKGWLYDYIQYTLNTEPPTVFHFTVGLTVIGTILARKTFFRKGAVTLYPNLCICLVAPSGKCRKTSACNIGVGLLRKVQADVLADQTTPESLISALEGRESATGLIYAPELKVFLGTQRYLDGMVPLLTALFDSPDEFRKRTEGGGERCLKNVGLSFLGCTTLDWLRKLPADAFGGGFMSRFLFVIQEDTPRRFALPPPLSQELGTKLLRGLITLSHASGEWVMTEGATRFYTDWYNERKELQTHSSVQYAGYFERKPDHLLRLCMCLGASENSRELIITKELLQQGLRVLDWLEAQMPAMFDQLQQTEAGEEQQRVVQMMRKAGGHMEWAEFVKRSAHFMTLQKLEQTVRLLREAKMIQHDRRTNTIYLTTEGWK